MIEPIKVLFVCTANYCRSPLAEVIFSELLEKAHLAEYFFIDSAGTHGVFAGASPDPRSQAIAQKHGLKMQHIVSRQITLHDFHYFDYIVAMDHSNVEHLMALCPSAFQSKISLLLSHDAELSSDVFDPYSGGEQGFEQVFDLIVKGAQGLLATIKQKHNL
ncbi:arsenate reductase/protein-tyrosine-phosphatase family protein [Candidatus Berkiella aquae]|uniref:protein-tyrosine-phosphatase n=1 Tax=Candidatus Berkiella aquae TaxID=295108 RepID=A0A0Q9YPY4_9GAMM|nr:low molecular weight protein-tyrosine-phosphatase [Candidatus Berkiella aquae]MCS5711786.1 low molecular weight phosphotyrosine protein phosphatase [Candidatus Berkiella aquae]